MKYLSVCSGIEAASVAWHSLGWEPLAFSEIEAFPRAVLAHHYPQVPLHGDFTVLRDQDWIADADVLVGGTPCQAFSVAGLRKSLDDDRGNLSLEFVRLADAIDTVRSRRGREPGIIVWENVPGVLSVKDNAFGCFLAALAGESAPLVPPRGKWTNAGVVDGPQRTVAWRVLDAQYFGLAQRRRRVFVVASARDGFDPAAVFLEFEGVRRDTPPRREKREIAPTIPSRSTAGGGLGTDFDCDGGVIRAVAFSAKDHGADATEDLSPTLRAMPHDASHANGGGQMAVAIPVQEVGKRTGTSTTDPRAGIGIGEDGDPMYTLQAGAQHGVAVEPYTLAIRGRGDSHQLEYRQDGTANAILTPNGGRAGIGVGAVAHAQSGEPGKGDAAPCVAVFPIDMYNAKRDPEKHDAINRNAVGVGNEGDPSYTLNRVDVHGVAVVGDAAPCVAVGAFKYTMGAKAHGIGYAEEQSPTLDTRPESNAVFSQHMAVRRLTPVECERLQGFPDNYTAIPWKKKPAADCPDGPRYKALGNSMAVPVMAWIGTRIARHLRGEL